MQRPSDLEKLEFWREHWTAITNQEGSARERYMKINGKWRMEFEFW